MRSEPELISILICTHNRCESLGRTLDSLETLNSKEHLAREVVVVDNASGDRTREVVEAFGARSSIPVRYILEARLGHSQALNTGIEHSSGDIVAFTDDDAIVSPHWLEHIASTFDESRAGIVFGKVDPFWETGEPPWLTRGDHGRFALLDYGPESFVVNDKEHPFFGVNVAIRREVLNSLRGYRTDKGPCGKHGGSGADIDLFERALASGVRIVYNPNVVVRHFIPSIRCTKRFQRIGAKNSREQYCRFVRETEKSLPQLLGLPRYRYRLAASNLYQYLMNAIRGKEPEQFYHELQLRRFFWLFVQSRGRDRSVAPDRSQSECRYPRPRQAHDESLVDNRTPSQDPDEIIY
jgi:glucosyl-dolichyl phosphate glucuronosyltransferase